MNGRRSVRQRIRKRANGVDIAADINAEIAVNSGDSGRTAVSRSTQNTTITQTSKGTDTDTTDRDREKR